MFEEFFNEWTKEYQDNARVSLVNLKKKYDVFWKELMEGLEHDKVRLEAEIVEISKKKTQRLDDLEKLDGTYSALVKKVEKEEKTFQALQASQVKEAKLLGDYEEKANKMVAREKAVAEKEKEQSEKEMELKFIQADINEKQQSIKRAFDRAHG